jgi:hypothetical protein
MPFVNDEDIESVERRLNDLAAALADARNERDAYMRSYNDVCRDRDWYMAGLEKVIAKSWIYTTTTAELREIATTHLNLTP